MIRFGTGGWRAVIADEFTRENIRLLTEGICRLMAEEGRAGEKVCIGYDRRFLSKESAHWAAEVFAGNGYPVYIIDRPAPTPLIMYCVREMGLSYGLAVTASHNPAIYNGIKVFTSGGRDADKNVTSRIEEKIDGIGTGPVPSVDYDVALKSGLIEEGSPANAYIDSVLAAVDTGSIKKAGLNVVLDPMYGVSKTILQTILITCRCDVDIIHDRHDTLFGGKLPAPNEDTLVPLSNYVKDHHADIGIATDGDADRLGVIDENGVFVHPNLLLELLYYYLIAYKNWHGPCVRNNSTTHMLDRIAAAYGEICYEVPVGFKWVSAKMTETNAIIGGESSGGMAIRGHISGKDGIYAAALLAEMLAVTGKSVSKLAEEITERFGRLCYYDTDFRMKPAYKEELRELLFTEKRVPAFEKEIDHISYEDGCKIYFADGSWVICRFSGTEPLLRIAAEAETPEGAKALAETWRSFLKL